jgi:hypothetical protein
MAPIGIGIGLKLGGLLGGGVRGFSLARDIFGNGDYAGFDYTDLDIGKVWGPDGLKLLYNANLIDPVGASTETVQHLIDKSRGLLLSPLTLNDPGFDDDSKWDHAAGWTVADGAAVLDGTQSNQHLRTAASIPPKGIAKVAVDVLEKGSSLTTLANVSEGSLLPFWPISVGRNVAYVQANAGYSKMGWQTGTGGANRDLKLDNAAFDLVLGNHALQPTANSRPSWNDNGGGINVPYLNFDGSDDWLASPLQVASEMTVAACLRATDTAGTKTVIGAQTSAQRCRLSVDASGNVCAAWGNQQENTINSGIAVEGVDAVVLLRANASIVELWVNGVLEYSAAADGSGAQTTQPLWIGGHNSAGTLTMPFNGRISRPFAVQRFIPDNMILPLMRLLGAGVVSF